MAERSPARIFDLRLELEIFSLFILMMIQGYWQRSREFLLRTTNQ
jgi:hypothetical protein